MNQLRSKQDKIANVIDEIVEDIGGVMHALGGLCFVTSLDNTASCAR